MLERYTTTERQQKSLTIGTHYWTHEGAPTSNWRYHTASSLKEWAEQNWKKFICGGTSNFITPIHWGAKITVDPYYSDSEEIEYNYRDGSCFQSAGWLMLEFDDPDSMRYEDAVRHFSAIAGFIHTSKSHQKIKGSSPACDRYHVALELDRAITDSREYNLCALALQSLYSTADDTADTARCFRCTSFNGKFNLFPGELRLSVDALLRRAKEQGISAGKLDYEDSEPIHTSGGSVSSCALTALEEMDFDFNRHTRDLISDAGKVAFLACESDVDTVATLESLGWIQSYLHRHSEAEFLQNAKHGIKRARMSKAHFKEVPLTDCIASIQGRQLRAKGEVLEVKSADLPPMTEKFRCEYTSWDDAGRLRFTSGAPEDVAVMESVARVVQWQQSSDLAAPAHAVLDTNCGAGKTTTARVYMACAASSDEPVWYAARGRAEAAKMRDMLEDYHHLKPVLIMGFRRSDCTLPVELQPAKDADFYNPAKSPCKSCSNKCPYGTYKFCWASVELSPIVILTHELAITLLNRDKIPHHVSLMVDEQMSRMDNQTVSLRQWQAWKRSLLAYDRPVCRTHHRLKQVVRRNNGNKDIYGRTIWATEYKRFEIARALHRQKRTVTRNTLINAQGAAEDMSPRIKREDSVHWVNHLRSLQNNSRGVPVEDLVRWVQFQTGENIPMVTRSADNYFFHKIRLKNYWRLLRKFLILDGSASYNNDNWDGLVTIKVTDIKQQSYGNTAFHVIPAMPTKRNADKFQNVILDKARLLLNENWYENPLLITNATASEEEERFLEDYPECIHFTRGREARGGNRGNECDLCIVTSSIFSSISSVTLTAAVTAGAKSVSPDRLFDANGKPLIRHGAFLDRGINDVVQRETVDMLQQMLMRGVIRSDSYSMYGVLMSVASWEALAEIMMKIPPEKVSLIGKTYDRSLGMFINLYNEARSWNLDSSDGVTLEAYKVAGLTPRRANAEQRETLKNMLGYIGQIW